MAYKTDANRKSVKEKVDEVKSTISEMKKYKTLVLIDLRQLPDALLQSIRKRIREDGGKLFVLRKPVITRVLSSDERLKSYAAECTKPMALICTEKSPFEMNSFFKEFRRKKAAKVGDVSNIDLIIPAGDTDLPPGPALSELKSAGLNVQIKAGKIAVIKDSMVAKAGEKLTGPKVKALQTLNVMPFEVMAKFVMGYDGHYIYTKALLDDAEALPTDLAAALGQGRDVSLNMGYPTELNISILLGDAFLQAFNVSLNGSLYSSNSMEQLLVSAMRQGTAISGTEKK